MALKYQVDSLDGIDEAKHDLYQKGDNGYTLKVDGVVPKSKYDEVNQKAVDATTEAARRRKTNERVLSKLGLEDASGLDDALDGLLTRKGGNDDDAQKAVIEQIKAAADAEKAALQSQLDGIRKDGLKAQLKSELMAVGFGDKVAEMVAQSNVGKVKFDDAGKMRIMQDNGNPLAGSGADGFANLADLSTQLAAAMPELLTDTGKGGGGKPPASSAQGSAKKFSDMSSGEKVRLKRTNLAEYERLKGAAA